MRRIAADIWDELNTHAPEQSVTVPFGLTDEELRMLNEDGKVTINLFERTPKIVRDDWENIRIFKLGTEELLVHPEGGPYGGTALLFLTFEHSGISRLSSRGETYLFRHYRHTDVNPITWEGVYDGTRLRHMLDYAVEATQMAEGRQRRDLETDRQFCLALTHLVEIVGEAAARVSPTGHERWQTIPWRGVVGLRNRLVRSYDAVDLNIP